MEGIILLGSIALLLVVIRLIAVKRNSSRGWRVRQVGANQFEYTELDENGIWRSLTFESELNAKGYPRHVLQIPLNWDVFPEWAQENKSQIMERVTEKCKSPTYTIEEL